MIQIFTWEKNVKTLLDIESLCCRSCFALLPLTSIRAISVLKSLLMAGILYRSLILFSLY